MKKSLIKRIKKYNMTYEEAEDERKNRPLFKSELSFLKGRVNLFLWRIKNKEEELIIKGSGEIEETEELKEAEKIKKNEEITKEPYSDLKISIITPLFNTKPEYLTELLDSVTEQSCKNYEIILADASDEVNSYVKEIVDSYKKRDSRIIYKRLLKNEGISKNTNEALSYATGDYIGLLDHDDILHPDLIFELIKEIKKSSPDIIYTDEATFKDKNGKRIIVSKNEKADYSPHTLLHINYITHFLCFKREMVKDLISKKELLRPEYDGSQDHDLILRLTERAEDENISHIKKILYFWRIHEGSVSGGVEAKEYAVSSGKRAVLDAIKRRDEYKDFDIRIDSVAVNRTEYRIRFLKKDEEEKDGRKEKAGKEGADPFDEILIYPDDSRDDIIKKAKESNKEFLFFKGINYLPAWAGSENFESENPGRENPGRENSRSENFERRNPGRENPGRENPGRKNRESETQEYDELYQSIYLSMERNAGFVFGRVISKYGTELEKMEPFDSLYELGKNYYCHNDESFSFPAADTPPAVIKKERFFELINGIKKYHDIVNPYLLFIEK